MKHYRYPLSSGIRSTSEFAKKGLAAYAVNVGLKCDHDCTYCSSGAMLRCHDAFKKVNESPYDFGYAIVDPEIPEKVAKDAAKIRRRGVVQLCTTVDAWAPAAQRHDLGRRCLEAILAQPGWTVRILTKNAAVANDFDLIRKHKDQLLVGLSLTGTADKENVLSVIEPNASPITERMAALKKARKLGLRTYGMLCPLLPGIADDPKQIDKLVRFVKDCGAEEVFAEAVNPRGRGLRLTEEALRANGFEVEGVAVSQIRHRKHWSPYVVALSVCGHEDFPCCGCDDGVQHFDDICLSCNEPFEFCRCDEFTDEDGEEDEDCEPHEEMDGDFDTAMRDAGFGMDEDYLPGGECDCGDW